MISDWRKRVVLPPQVTPRLLLALIALTGILLSVYVAYEEYRQHRAIERLRIGEYIDAHFATVNDHIVARSNLARTVSRFFVPPPLNAARPLGDFGTRALGLASDVTTLGWLPEVEASRIPDVLESLRRSGVQDPQLRGPEGPIDPTKLDRPLYPIIDIAPERNRFVLGVDAGAFPERLEAIRTAKAKREPTRTRPLRLVQSPDEAALLLYAPIFDESGGFLGVMGFGFKTEEFFRGALNAAKIPPATAVKVFTQGSAEPVFDFRPEGFGAGIADNRLAYFDRRMEFAGGELRFVYAVARNIQREALLHGLLIGGLGLLLTFVAVLILEHMSSRASALAREVSSRRSAEDRLKVLIHELNHRVRNVMSVAMAVVRLSFTTGSSVPEIQKTCEGRLQALANAMSLLTASDWKSLSLRSLIVEDIIPFAKRIQVEGPDIALRSRSAQTFALLLYELAVNAATHGALSVPEGEVLLRWRIDNLAGDPIFHLHWKESGGPQVTGPVRKGFGELLIRRIAPRDVAGKSEVRYEAAGYEYELQAPLRELIEIPER